MSQKCIITFEAPVELKNALDAEAKRRCINRSSLIKNELSIFLSNKGSEKWKKKKKILAW
mgnify:CR=1 FL=1